MTDVCALYPWIEHSPQEEPVAPYMWLGAAVEPGVVEYDNGYVQETIEVDGTTVTVGAADAGLREKILGSARIDEDAICPLTYPGVPDGAVDTMANGAMGPPFAWVCAYRRTGDGRFDLSYADSVDLNAANDASDAQMACPGTAGRLRLRPDRVRRTGDPPPRADGSRGPSTRPAARGARCTSAGT